MQRVTSHPFYQEFNSGGNWLLTTYNWAQSLCSSEHILGKTCTAASSCPRAANSLVAGTEFTTPTKPLCSPPLKEHTVWGMKRGGHLQRPSSLLALKCCIDRGIRIMGEFFDFWQCYDAIGAGASPIREVQGGTMHRGA